MRFNKATLTAGTFRQQGAFDVFSNGNVIEIYDPKTCKIIVVLEHPHVDFQSEDITEIEGFGKIVGQYQKVKFHGEKATASE